MASFLFVAGSSNLHSDAEKRWSHEVLRAAMSAMKAGDSVVAGSADGPDRWAAEVARGRGISTTVLELHSANRYDDGRLTRVWYADWKDWNDWAFTTQQQRHGYKNDTLIAYAQAARRAGHHANFLTLLRSANTRLDWGFDVVSDLVLKASAGGFLVSEKVYVEQPAGLDIVWIDLETGGLSETQNPILEIGAVWTDSSGRKVRGTFDTKVAVPQGFWVHQEAAEVCGYHPAKWLGAPKDTEAILQFSKWLPHRYMHGGYNCPFDQRFLDHNIARLGILPVGRAGTIDVIRSVKQLKKIGRIQSASLDSACSHFGISSDVHHRALADAERARLVYLKMLGLTPESSVLPTTQVSLDTEPPLARNP